MCETTLGMLQYSLKDKNLQMYAMSTLGFHLKTCQRTCALWVLCAACLIVFVTPKPVAAGLIPCKCTQEIHGQMEPGSCSQNDCDGAEDEIDDDHNDGGTPQGEYDILIFIQEQFNLYRDWVTNTFFLKHFLKEAMKMTEQLSAVGMQQAFIVGTMFDAKHQLETQRTFQALQAQAQVDYQPSQSFCRFGTAARSLAHSEQRGRLDAQALNDRQMERHLGSSADGISGTAGSKNSNGDLSARWTEFITTYCDPQDNNYRGGSTGLVLACGAGGNRTNHDIDFTRLMEHERTLNVNFANTSINNGISQANHSQDEQDVLAMSSNLYGHRTLARGPDSDHLDNAETAHLYLALRAVAAKRNVAENSYNNLVGLRAAGTTNIGSPGKQTRNFLGAVIKELGVADDNEIYQLIGENPSYYAQLEILAKKILQNTDFFTNLYDTPTNIARKSVALKAISMMLDRAIYESEVRQELATSVLLATRLQDEQFKVLNEDLSNQDGS